MTRKSIIKKVGELKPSLYYNERTAETKTSYTSLFIIPLPHKTHTLKNANQLFNDIEQNWEIKNNTINKDLSLFVIKEYIKKKTFEKIDLRNAKNKKSFLYDAKNLYLTHKEQKEIRLQFDNIEVILKEIDLWVMDGNVAFFSYKITLDKDKLYDINTLSTQLHRNLRDYKSITIDTKNKRLYIGEEKGIPLLKYLFSLTYNDEEKSFLNISWKELAVCFGEKNSAQEFNDTLADDLSVIATSTYYAKTLTALHIDKNSVNIHGKEEVISKIADQLSESVIIDIGILEELAYLFATTSSFYFENEMSYVANESYVYNILQNDGINIWKFWSGVALQDSVAFFSVADGGTSIVFAAEKQNYFMYIINLYINIRLKYTENYLIDKDFISIEKLLPSIRDIQILKNHYITSEIATKFQENHINQKMCSGLKTDKLLNEVEENLQVTLDITKSNTDIIFSVGAGIATLGSMWLTNDFIISLYHQHPYLTWFGVIALLLIVTFIASKKSLVIKKVKNTIKYFKRFLKV